MKICSDSLLFGALIPINGTESILDIGTGTGILSLMQAQKSNAVALKPVKKIIAVELTVEAALEAKENFDQSPWANQLELVEQDIQTFAENHSKAEHQLFDLIICNPPFFSRHSKTAEKDPLRHIARHTDSLSFHDLFHSINQLLTSSGCAYFLLPKTSLLEFTEAALEYDMLSVESTDLAESASHTAKVSVLKFMRKHHAISQGLPESRPVNQRLNKFALPNEHTDEVKVLLKPFLLRYG